MHTARRKPGCMKAAVIGSGAWGTTLAMILAENGHEVVIWSHDQGLADSINNEHENKQLFAGVKLPAGIRATTSFEEAGRGSALVVVVTASKFIGSTVRALVPHIPAEALIVSAVKGLNPGDNKRPSELLRESLPEERRRRVAAVSVSRRVAEELGVGWGREVGCKIRFNDETSPDTCIKFMTDGMLLAEVQGDPNLAEYALFLRRNCDAALRSQLNADLEAWDKALAARVVPWVIDYKRWNDPARNKFFATAPEIEHKVG